MAKFTKGEPSPNPNGRPPGSHSSKDILRKLLSEPYAETDTPTVEKIIRNVVNDAVSGDKWSINFVFDRLEGKPPNVTRIVNDDMQRIHDLKEKMADSLVEVADMVKKRDTVRAFIMQTPDKTDT